MSSHEPQPAAAIVEEWTRMLYDELRRIARRERFHVAGGETLATTALINEAYVHMARVPGYGSRGHFLGTAAVVMRRILVDRVRAQLTAKRGGGERDVTLDDTADFVVEDDQTVLAIHEALESLAGLNPRLARVVECRFFAGYDETETAEALGVSNSTVQRDWTTARLWLKRELGGQEHTR